MNKLIGLLLLLASSFSSFARESIDFSFPDSLKENADVVVLFDNTEYERKSETILVERNKIAFTILNNRADGFEQMVIDYDDLSKINSISCSIYDKHGQLSKRVKKGDIMDFSYYSDFTLYSDNRVKVVSALHQSYPYTVVFEYEKVYDGFFMLNSWMPVSDYRLAILHSSLKITTPKDLPFIYKEERGDMLKVESKESEFIVNHWSLDNFKALEYEDYSPSFVKQIPQVYIAPKRFEYDGHKGSNESWASNGEFFNSLLYDDNELTKKTKADLLALKVKAKDKEELTRLVYEYMQSKTRYVGVQLGIGGWQPFPSLSVDGKGYGDCKALSYYTKIMLEYVGIDAIYTVIGAGNVKIRYDDFPVNQTNHVILCVPSEQDTFWLECTSQTAPFNYLSANCTNRKVLLVKDEGSELFYVNQKHENTRVRESAMSLQADGRLYCENTSIYTGSFFDSKSDLARMSSKELTLYLQKSTPVSGISINSCAAHLDRERVVMTVNNNFYASDVASKAGDRVFVDLSPFAQLAAFKKQRSERQNKVMLRSDKTYTDRISLAVPEGYGVEFLPKNKVESSDYGDYSFQVNNEDGTVIVERVFSVKSGTYPKEKYDEFIAFFNNLAKMDKCKVAFKKL